METKVTIILVVRETYYFSPRVLESVYQHTKLPFQLIYVAGAAPTKERYEFEKAAEQHKFLLIQRPYVLSQNEARNLALPHVVTPYVVILDNDCIVGEGWLESLLSVMEETPAVMVQPLTYLGEPDKRLLHFFTGTCHLVKENGLSRVDERYPYHLLKFDDLPEPLTRRPTEMVEYHCLLLRKTFLDRLGFFDEDLKSTRDHHDLSLKAQEWGELVLSEPTAKVYYFHPPPFLWRELPYFLVRWSPLWNQISHHRMDTKWNITGSARNLGFLNSHRRIHLENLRNTAQKVLGKKLTSWFWMTILYPLESKLADYFAKRNERIKSDYLENA